MQVRTPCEAVVVDLLVREDTFGAIEPEMAVYGEQSGGSSYPAPGSERDLLPIRQPVLSLGKGPSVLHTPDVPRYAEMARFAFDRLGWEAERFDVFRIRIEYPVMPSSVVLRFELPENEPAPQ